MILQNNLNIPCLKPSCIWYRIKYTNKMQVHLNSNTLDIKTLDTKPDTTKGNRICLGKGMKREVKRNSKKKEKKKERKKKEWNIT